MAQKKHYISWVPYLRKFTKTKAASLGMLMDIEDLYDCAEEFLKSCNFRPDKHNITGFREKFTEFYGKYKYVFRDDPYPYVNATRTREVLHSAIRAGYDRNNHEYTYSMTGLSEFTSCVGTICAAIAYKHELMDANEVLEDIYVRMDQLSVDSPRIKRDLPDAMLDTDTLLYIYKSFTNLKCVRDKHNVTAMNLYYSTVTTGESIELPVHFCKNCGKHFISKMSLSTYDRMAGKIMVRTNSLDVPNDAFSKYNAESELYSWGYNVADGELSEQTRQSILVWLVENEKMTSLEICRDILRNINAFEEISRYQQAVRRWKSDYDFIVRYDVGRQVDYVNAATREVITSANSSDMEGSSLE